MANDEHVALLKQGVDAWNKWRDKNRSIHPDLTHADLNGANLEGADLSWANLEGASLRDAYFGKATVGRANLTHADLSEANLEGADLTEANLSGAILFEAYLGDANLTEANLRGADLRKAYLSGADLSGADLTGSRLNVANLTGARLKAANFTGARLKGANLAGADGTEMNLSEADLRFAALVHTNLTLANLTGCRIHGVSAWGLKLEKAKQQNLIISSEGEPEITVDNIEVAQFIYLLLHNPKIRDVIDTIGRKAVLILGRFTPERKAVLDALREKLRERDYVPILFDFDKPASQDLTTTVSTLAHLARFIIADLTDPSSIPYELATVVPTTPIPVQPILLTGCREFAMFQDLRRRHHWVLPTHRYDTPGQLIGDLDARVIRPAETKVLELRE